MTVKISFSEPLKTGTPGQIQAPPENIAQFKALLGNIQSTLSQSTPAMNKTSNDPMKGNGNLIENAALDVHNVETVTSVMKAEIRKNIDALNSTPTMEAKFTQSIVKAQYSEAAYFLTTNMLSTQAIDMASEVGSLTQGH